MEVEVPCRAAVRFTGQFVSSYQDLELLDAMIGCRKQDLVPNAGDIYRRPRKTRPRMPAPPEYDAKADQESRVRLVVLSRKGTGSVGQASTLNPLAGARDVCRA